MGPEKTVRPSPTGTPAVLPSGERRLPASRVGRTWSALLPTAAVIVVVLVFVLQHQRRDHVTLLFWPGRVPHGVGLLTSAALAAPAVFRLGSVRILRRLADRGNFP